MNWDWYINAAQNAWEAGQSSRAEQLLYTALEHASYFDERDERFLYTLDRLVQVLSSQRKHSTAEPFCKRALDVKVQALGEEHLEVAATLNTLAGLYFSQGNYALAEPLVEKAMAIYQKLLDPVNPLVGLTAANLAILYHMRQKYEKAGALYDLAIAIKTRELGQDSAQVHWLKAKYSALKCLTGAAPPARTQTLPIMQRLERAILKNQDALPEAKEQPRLSRAVNSSHTYTIKSPD